jgi:hypothetical protein
MARGDGWQYVLLQPFRSFPRNKKIVRLLRPKKIAPTIWVKPCPRLHAVSQFAALWHDHSIHQLPLLGRWCRLPPLKAWMLPVLAPWPGRRHLAGTPLRRSEGQTSRPSSLPGHISSTRKGRRSREGDLMRRKIAFAAETGISRAWSKMTVL